jgi:hypothetical protein
LDITLETQKFRVRNPLNQELHFCIENTLKLTYKHLEVKKIFRGLRPLDPQEGEGKGRVGRGGGNRRGEGRGGRGQEGKRGRGEKGREGRRREGKERGRNVAPSKNSLKKRLCTSETDINNIVSKARQRLGVLFRGILTRDICVMRQAFIVYIRTPYFRI